ncbi:DUF4355 domain-containing protein [Lacticaseibacillus rhamnosus]
MTEFTPITSQDELDKIIAARLSRQKESIQSQLSGELDKLKARNEELATENGTLKTAAEKAKEAAANTQKTLADLNSKVSSYEKSNLRTKIALKNGLPYDLADRLVGDDEKSMQADAERLASFVQSHQQEPPLKDPDLGSKSGKDSAYMSLIDNLNLKGE